MKIFINNTYELLSIYSEEQFKEVLLRNLLMSGYQYSYYPEDNASISCDSIYYYSMSSLSQHRYKMHSRVGAIYLIQDKITEKYFYISLENNPSTKQYIVNYLRPTFPKVFKPKYTLHFSTEILDEIIDL